MTNKLLVIEDNEEHMRWILNLIQEKGAVLDYEVRYYTQDWNMAHRLLQDNSDQIDIVVTDLQDTSTGKFIGFDIIKEAKKRGKRVVAVSSFLDDEVHMRDVLESGADFYVKKPFKPEWRVWEEYPEELGRSAELSLYFALRRFVDEDDYREETGQWLERLTNLEQELNRYHFLLRSLAGLVVAAMGISMILLLPTLLSWQWLIGHSNKLGLQASATVIVLGVSWIIIDTDKNRRRFALGSVVLAAAISVLQLL